MAKKQDTIWKLEAHTDAKHTLLAAYLSRWVPILAGGQHGARDLVIIDGFAGPGVYADGEPGSPVLMARAFLNAQTPPKTRLHCFFVEEERKRFEELERRTHGFRNDRCRIETLHGRYEDHFDAIMAQVDHLDEPAVFAFLDPYGGPGDADLAVQLVLRERSEAIVYLPVDRFARLITQPEIGRTLTGIFGDERWRPLCNVKATDDRVRLLADMYAQRLAEGGQGGRQRFWVERFWMRPDSGNRYCLFLATKHRKAVEVFREAAWKVDPHNGRQFDPRDGLQLYLESWKPDLASAIRKRYPSGSEFDFADAWRWIVDCEPPFDQPRLRAALQYLRDGTPPQVEVIDRKTGKVTRRGFAPGNVIRSL